MSDGCFMEEQLDSAGTVKTTAGQVQTERRFGTNLAFWTKRVARSNAGCGGSLS